MEIHMETIKRQWNMRWVYGETQSVLICLGAVFFLGMIGTLIGIEFFDVRNPPLVGTIGAFLIAGFGQFILAGFGFASEFNLAVSLGETRKKFVWSFQLFSLAEIVFILLSVFVFFSIEQFVYGMVTGAPLWENGILELLKIGKPQYLAAGIVVILALEMLVQALMLRFGVKAFWVIWGAWMTVSIFGIRLTKLEAFQSLKEVLRNGTIFAEMGSAFWVLAAFAASAVTVGISWNILRKQRVTS